VRTHSTFKGWAFNFQGDAPPSSSKWWLLFQAPSSGHQSVWLRRREGRWKLCFQLSTLIFSLLKNEREVERMRSGEDEQRVMVREGMAIYRQQLKPILAKISPKNAIKINEKEK
jgi:hypothetical protein